MAVTAVLIGAGLRGRFAYGGYALARPDRLRVVAVAEPDPVRAAAVAAEHGLPADRVFDDWKPLLERSALAEVAIVATGDRLHVAPALAALQRGYHLLLEKPIAPTAAECLRVVEAAQRAGRLLQVGHVLRHAPFYEKVHHVVASGSLGRPISIELGEHVGHWHMAHSYVRGKFRNRELAAPMLLAKGCHDLDLLVWLADRPAARVASYGGLAHFRPESAPPGAPARCTDGCPVQADCPHDAVRFYLGPDETLARGWPWSDLSADPSREARRRALETGPYGRCVYRCDNDAVDHQVVLVEFEGGLVASFGLHGHAAHERRTIRVTGTRGELRGVLQTGAIEVTRPGSLGVERHSIEEPAVGHFGGDRGLLDHFSDVVARGAAAELRASGRATLEAHLIGFAAEEARRRGAGVAMRAWRRAAGAGAGS